MTITINQQEYMVNEGATVRDALNLLTDLPQAGYAVALNNDVVPKDEWDSKPLTDGAKLMVIKAFFGG